MTSSRRIQGRFHRELLGTRAAIMGRNTCEHVFGASLRLCSLRSHLILQASFRQYARSCLLAALVLEIDTIPKPHGLGRLMHTVHIELNSIDFEPCSKMIDNCSTAFDFECRSARSRRGGAPTLTIITRTLSVLINIKNHSRYISYHYQSPALHRFQSAPRPHFHAGRQRKR